MLSRRKFMGIAVLPHKTKVSETWCDESDERCLVRWTREDAEKLADLGLIPERYELVEGVIYSKMGQKPPHRIVLNEIYRWLASVFGLKFLLGQQPITLDLPHENDGDLEPDITVLNRPEPEFKASDPTSTDIVLCVEIAYTSLSEDTTRKAGIYAQNGIAEYWIADVKKRQMIVHREPASDGYHLIKIYTADETLSLISRPDASISVSELIPDTETATA